MQLVGIMGNRTRAQKLESCLWSQFGGVVALRLQDWATKARWLCAFDLCKDTDHVVVSDVRSERDATFIESLGGVVLRL